MNTDVTRTVLRLLVVQASWTYERMQGVGIGFASLPLLGRLEDPVRRAAAIARATEYFNAHPYLDGVAVGAATRAEIDGVPPVTIQRLKTALAGPLGSLGDQLFWIGVLPAVAAAMVVAVVFGAGLPAVAAGVAAYLAIRLYVTVWGTRLGLAAGLSVATALKASRLTDLVRRVGLLAGTLVGVAVPLAGRWLAGDDPGTAGQAAFGFGTALGIVAALVRFRVPTARQVTLVAMAAVVLWHWSV